MKKLTIEHPIIEQNIETFISSDYASGTTLYVKSTSGFNANDYIILGKIGLEQTEIVQIQTVVSTTQITLATAASYPHASDTVVTQIAYNQFKIYRSLTGVGGSYTSYYSGNLQIDQMVNYYQDTTSVSPASFRFSYVNSSSSNESTLSDEIPWTGYPDWSLKALQDAVLILFGDEKQRFITRDMITIWINQCYRRMQLAILGSDTPYFVQSINIISTGAENYDISSYDFIKIFLIELSIDGINWNQTLTPRDFRFRDNPGGITLYEYQIAGETMVVRPTLPNGYIMKVWYFTQPVYLQNPTDTIAEPLRLATEVFIDFALMRAHEKDRKMTELAIYYQNNVNLAFTDNDGIVKKIKNRLKQGNILMASTWGDDNDTLMW